MKSELPMMTNNSFISKIKCFFSKLFNKSTKKSNNNLELDNNSNVSNSTNVSNLKETIKYDISEKVNEQLEVKNLVKNAEENPDFLETLSIDELEKIDTYYDNTIENYNKKIETLKKKLA